MIDLPGLKFDLGEDIEVLRLAVRDWAQGELAPRAGEIDRIGRFPMDAWRKIDELGVLGITVVEEYGGASIGYLAYMTAMEEINCVPAPVGLSYGAYSNLYVNQIHRSGTVTQKAKYLPKLISGERVEVLAISEPNAGLGVISMKLHVESKGDRYTFNGTKVQITNGPDCDVLVVYAKAGSEPNAHGMTAFVVEKGMGGFSATQKLDKLGVRGSHTGKLVFENVEVPMENILGQEDGSTKALMSDLGYGCTVLSGSPIGTMQAYTDVVTPYIHDRKQLGQNAGEFQFIQGEMASTYTTSQACHAHLYTVDKNLDSSDRNHACQVRKNCIGVILYAAEKATWMVGEAIQILDGNGYTSELPVGHLWCDAKLYEIGASMSEIRRMLIGRKLYAETMQLARADGAGARGHQSSG